MHGSGFGLSNPFTTISRGRATNAIRMRTPLSPAPRLVQRRADTPSSSSPIREDFDELDYTTTRPDRSTAVFDAPTAHSPIAEDFDAPTTTRPTTTVEQENVDGDFSRRIVLPRPPRAVQPPYSPRMGHTRHQSEGSLPIQHSRVTSPADRQEEVLDDFEDYDQFLDETDRVFRAGSLAQASRFTLSLSHSHSLQRSSIPERPSNRLVDGLTSTDSRTGMSPGVQTATHNVSSPLIGTSKSLSRSGTGTGRRMSTFRRSPNARTEFAMVDNTVIVQDAEKTVEVSAWREQVAREAEEGNQRMSVYYVMQNDVLEAGRGAFREIKLDQTMEESRGASIEYHRLTPPQPNHSPNRMRSFSIDSASGGFRPARTSSPYPFRTTTQVRPSGHHLSGRLAPPTPPRSQNNSTPQTGSSPLSRHSSRSKGLDRIHTTLEDVARRPASPAAQLALARVHPSFSMVENILADCQPSLIHIGPILARLGITSEDHLIAVMKMREETRDREVREEALRQGITVVEWAMFVDRLLNVF